MERLLSYHNVSVFYFQNMYDFITDLDNYSDYTRYGREMLQSCERCGELFNAETEGLYEYDVALCQNCLDAIEAE